MIARLGAVVFYRSKTGNYDLAAIVTATAESLSPAGVAAGEVPALSWPGHVHLQVLTPGRARHYQEFDVPMDDPAATADGVLLEAGVASEPKAGHWRYGL